MSDLKPGEYVGSDGLVYGVIQAIRVFEMAHGGHSAGVVCIDHPDFPAAVAALQSLIRPKQAVPLAGVHPGVGLRWCGEEGWWRSWSGAAHQPRCHLHSPGLPGPNKVEMRGEK